MYKKVDLITFFRRDAVTGERGVPTLIKKDLLSLLKLQDCLAYMLVIYSIYMLIDYFFVPPVSRNFFVAEILMKFRKTGLVIFQWGMKTHINVCNIVITEGWNLYKQSVNEKEKRCISDAAKRLLWFIFYAKMFGRLYPLNIFTKNFIIDVW